MTPLTRTLLGMVSVAVAISCGPTESQSGLRMWTDDLNFHITNEPAPPHAREDIQYKVVVRDSKSGQPVERGEGRIFASTRDGASTWWPLEEGQELGTYYGKLRYVTAGEWAVAIQFRRDSTQRLQRLDWMQEVFAERASPVP